VHRRLWANLDDQDFVRFAQSVGRPLRNLSRNSGAGRGGLGAYSDNTSAAVLRWRAA